MDKEISHYLAQHPKERVAMLTQLFELILSLYPDANASLAYKMPTFKYKDGWVAFANQKHYVSLYTCGAHHLIEFKKQQPTVKTGTGCINFPPNKPLPLEDIKAVIVSAIEYPKPEHQR